MGHNEAMVIWTPNIIYAIEPRYDNHLMLGSPKIRHNHRTAISVHQLLLAQQNKTSDARKNGLCVEYVVSLVVHFCTVLDE